MKKFAVLMAVLVVIMTVCGCSLRSNSNNVASATPTPAQMQPGVPTVTPMMTAAPVVMTPVPVAPIATPAPGATVVNPVITKNPTPESVMVGGSCSFIAYANGYRSVAWQLVAPNGTIYDATSTNPYPGVLSIWGANSTTLNLANIPYEMNNWSARAVFVGDTQRVTSNGAAISVSKPAPVVYNSISFSSSSGTTFYSSPTYVNVYSTTGDNIRVECTQSGNTGAYYSETLPSGGSFPVKGNNGTTVTVYASSKNANATVTYYVYGQPSSQTKSGRVGFCDGSNAFINFDDGTSGTYYIANYVSNPPTGGERCTCTFVNGSLTGFTYKYTDPGSTSYTKSGTVITCDGNSAYISFYDGSSGSYNIANFVSNPPTGGEGCTCTFDAYGNLSGFTYNHVDPTGPDSGSGSGSGSGSSQGSYYDKSGTVTSCDGNNASISFYDGTSGTYYIACYVSNPPTGGESCTCSFTPDGELYAFSYTPKAQPTEEPWNIDPVEYPDPLAPGNNSYEYEDPIEYLDPLA